MIAAALWFFEVLSLTAQVIGLYIAINLISIIGAIIHLINYLLIVLLLLLIEVVIKFKKLIVFLCADSDALTHQRTGIRSKDLIEYPPGGTTYELLLFYLKLAIKNSTNLREENVENLLLLHGAIFRKEKISSSDIEDLPLQAMAESVLYDMDMQLEKIQQVRNILKSMGICCKNHLSTLNSSICQ